MALIFSDTVSISSQVWLGGTSGRSWEEPLQRRPEILIENALHIVPLRLSVVTIRLLTSWGPEGWSMMKDQRPNESFEVRSDVHCFYCHNGDCSRRHHSASTAATNQANAQVAAATRMERRARCTPSQISTPLLPAYMRNQANTSL